MNSMVSFRLLVSSSHWCVEYLPGELWFADLPLHLTNRPWCSLHNLSALPVVTLEGTKVLGSEFIQEVLVKSRDGLDKCE